MARLRRDRALHPDGYVVRARWEPGDGVLPGSPLSTGGPREAVVRFSRGGGLPRRLPDVVGFAVRVLDVHGPGRDQDLLLASTGSGRVTRHVLRPAYDLAGGPLSTILPYRTPVGRHTIVGRARSGVGRVTLDDLDRHGLAVAPTVELRLGDLEGPLLARVVPTGPLPRREAEALRFDPWRTGPELVPAGWLNALRRPSYRASRRGWSAPPAGLRAVAPDDERPSAATG